MTARAPKSRAGQKRRATPAKPFKDSFAVEAPNPDYDFLSMDIQPDQSLCDMYTEEYLSVMPQIDHVPRPYEDIVELVKKRKSFNFEGEKQIYIWLGQLSGLIKIGHSKDPRRRLIQSQSGSGETIFQFFIMDGDRAVERMIHEALKPFRHHGEWYYPAPQVLDWISQAEGYGGY